MFELIGVIILALIVSTPFIVAIQAHIENHCNKEMDELLKQI